MESIERLALPILRYREASAKWEPLAESPDEAVVAITRIRAMVHSALHLFSMDRNVEQPFGITVGALHTGAGHYLRAQELHLFYTATAPARKWRSPISRRHFLGNVARWRSWPPGRSAATSYWRRI